MLLLVRVSRQTNRFKRRTPTMSHANSRPRTSAHFLFRSTTTTKKRPRLREQCARIRNPFPFCDRRRGRRRRRVHNVTTIQTSWRQRHVARRSLSSVGSSTSLSRATPSKKNVARFSETIGRNPGTCSRVLHMKRAHTVRFGSAF